ncbi:MAG: agmatinase [Candidatus Omnitrophica bacterium]|nr:agmatinase [Candidatus Omnitrophota bacterium]
MNCNFGALPKQFTDYKKSKIVILPVPFDKTSTWVKGTNRGPRAIIEASANIELYDIETDTEVYRKGVFTAKEILSPDSKTMVAAVYKKVKDFLNDKKIVVTLGGEHSVSIGAIKAHSNIFPKMSVLHLDAHADRRKIYQGNKYNHACTMARAKEIVKNTLSVGIRSADRLELKDIDKKEIFYAHKIYNSISWIKTAINRLTEDVYITIDLDVFDVGIMPSTGTPEPGGLDWYLVINFLKEVARNKKIIGFDVVELCPTQNKAPDFLAAKLIYKILSYKFSSFSGNE